MAGIDRRLLEASWQGWIAFDLRPPGPWWLQWVWTTLFCLAVALLFTLLMAASAAPGGGAPSGAADWLGLYARNLIVSGTIGALIHALLALARRWLPPGSPQGWRPWQRGLFFTAVPLAGLAIGWPLGVELAGGDLRRWFVHRDATRIIGASLTWGVLFSLALYQYFATRARQIDAERRATEAQLRLLQAQMEPHFLFNTLANLHSLIDHEPQKAKRLLDGFTDYLRSTLAQLRTDDSTVGAELALAESYLQLLQTRMEDRLRWRIDADDAARAATLPPLVLQPLVENAIRHGLEPKVEGGTIHIQARLAGDTLVIEVHDDGLGLAAPAPRQPGTQPGAGVALANLRERLVSRHGPGARLELLAANPGTRAVLTLPLAAR